MASDPQIELRVARLENDSNAIYDLLSEHSRRFDAVDRSLGSIQTTLTEVVRRLPEPS